MKIAYFSPLPPLKSGIADYSAELLTVLRNHTKIDLFVDDYQVSKYIVNDLPIYSMRDFDRLINEREYDGIIYHIGNNHQYHANIYEIALNNPGIVVLHDFTIQHMLSMITFHKGLQEKYIDEMYYNHGEEGRGFAIDFISGNTLAPWDGDNAIKFPMNKRLIESSKGIIVHSFFARQNVKKVKKDIPVKVINMHCMHICESEQEEKLESRKRLGIDSDMFVLASFGFINSSRRIDKVISALKKIKDKSDVNFCYILVGEQNQADYPLAQMISNLGLDDMVEFVGFTEMDKYIDFMIASDLCINLRYPVYGETSANLHRMLGMGKAVLVSDVGSFSEYPDDVVVKISLSSEEEDIYNSLFKLMHDNEFNAKYSKNALSFAKNHCRLEDSAKGYVDFINSVNKSYYRAEGIIEDTAQCLVEMGIDDKCDMFIGDLSKDIAQILY